MDSVVRASAVAMNGCPQSQVSRMPVAALDALWRLPHFGQVTVGMTGSLVLLNCLA
jgi:hypothetical protein